MLSDINFRSAEAVRECDLFVTVGARFNSRYSAFGALKKRKVPLLQFDSDKAEIDKTCSSPMRSSATRARLSERCCP